MAPIEFVWQDLSFRIERETFEGRIVNDLYYRRHFLKSLRTEPHAPEADIIASFTAWLNDNPVDPFECIGGPCDGELIADRGHAFNPGTATGRYQRVGLEYRWTQAPS